MNTLEKIRNDDGIVVALHLAGRTRSNEGVNKSFAPHDLSVSNLANGEATIGFAGQYEPQEFVITLDTDTNDPENMVGKVAYDVLKKDIRHTRHPHGDATIIPRWLVELGKLGLSIANIFGRLAALERQAGAIEFDEWSMKGAILIGKLGTRNVCRIDLSADYDIDQVPYNNVAEDDGERLLTISKGGVTRKFHTLTSDDMGAIVDQASNPQPGTIVSQVPKPTT